VGRAKPQEGRGQAARAAAAGALTRGARARSISDDASAAESYDTAPDSAHGSPDRSVSAARGVSP
jgi:hypothetical protein